MGNDRDESTGVSTRSGVLDVRERPAVAGLAEPEPEGAHHDASAAVAGLQVAVRTLVDEGVLSVGLEAGDRPVADVSALLRALTQVEAVLGMRMAAAEAGGSLPFLSAGGMASQSYWSRSRARSLSRAGHLARTRRDLSDCWLAGVITAEHVDAAAKGVAGLPDEKSEAVLEGLSPLWGQVTPAAVASYCARARAIVDPPPEDPDLAAQKAHEARFLSFSVLDDTVHITGALARLDGELLMNTIHATAQRMRVAGDGLTSSQRRADALTHLAAAGASPPAGSGSPDDPGAGAGAGAGVGAGAPISITLTADLDAVTGSGFHLTPADLRFALCDPNLTPVVTAQGDTPGDSHHDARPPDRPLAPATPSTPSTPSTDPPRIGHHRLATLTAQALNTPRPLAVGRTQRVATTAQRRALAVRDNGCILPGCDITAAHCQIHHLQPWTEGGPTDLPNLVSLCWAHHRQVDLGRWDIHPQESGHPGTPANHGAPFTISVRPRSRWGQPRSQA